MDLSAKLQVRPGQRLRTVGGPDGFALDAEASGAATSEGLLVFARSEVDLATHRAAILESARADRLTWVAYPKAGRLGTDLDRDRLAAWFRDDGVRPVRQIALDETWSALRLRPG